MQLENASEKDFVAWQRWPHVYIFAEGNANPGTFASRYVFKIKNQKKQKKTNDSQQGREVCCQKQIVFVSTSKRLSSQQHPTFLPIQPFPYLVAQDLRLDERVMQFLRVVNRLLATDRAAAVAAGTYLFVFR